MTLVVMGRNFCELCGHHKAHHFRIGSDQTYSSVQPCSYQVGGEHNRDCRCNRFCEGFTPNPEKGDGLICKNCGEYVFVHKTEAKKLDDLTQSHPDRLVKMQGKDRAYKVIHTAMQLCCLWTIDTHVRNASDEEYQAMLPGYTIQCPRCRNIGVIEVVPNAFVIGPTWKWSYKK